MSVAGKTAVVTGGGAGIGRGIAERLETAGATVVVVDSDTETSPTLLWDLGERPAQLAEHLLERFGPIELIVNNVGVQSSHSFLELDEETFDRTFAVNVRGPWFFTKRLVQGLRDEGRPGAVLFVSSLHDTAVYRAPHYSTSKAAVAMLVKELAWELAPLDVRVNAVSPGTVSTSSNRLPLEGDYPVIAMRRVGTPDHVARVAVALLDDEISGYVTGANVPVDGGLALFNWMMLESPWSR